MTLYATCLQLLRPSLQLSFDVEDEEVLRSFRFHYPEVLPVTSRITIMTNTLDGGHARYHLSNDNGRGSSSTSSSCPAEIKDENRRTTTLINVKLKCQPNTIQSIKGGPLLFCDIIITQLLVIKSSLEASNFPWPSSIELLKSPGGGRHASPACPAIVRWDRLIDNQNKTISRAVHLNHRKIIWLIYWGAEGNGKGRTMP